MTTQDRTQQGGSSTPSATSREVASEFERLLREPGCPACRHVEEAERSYFSWLRIESFSVAEVQARIRAGMGMCPAHTRRLVDEFGEGHIMTIVVREAVTGARQRMRDEGELGPCPACDAVGFGGQRARQLVVDGLLDPATARLYSDHDGVCLPHFLHTASVLDAAPLKLMAERLVATLRQSDDAALVTVLAGADEDAERRARRRDRLPDPAAPSSTVQELAGRLEIEACPVCLTAAMGERGYLTWLLARTAEGDRSLENDPGEVCRAHLHDLAGANRVLAAGAIEHKRAIRLGQLNRLLARLAELPAPGRRGRRTGAGLDGVREELIATAYCPACNAREGIERAQLELIGVGLSLAPIRERYERSHGLCARHALQMSDGQAARLTKRHADARLGVLAWELHETARKYGWAYRHESDGPERDSWVRALAQIDGRVFEGNPALGQL